MSRWGERFNIGYLVTGAGALTWVLGGLAGSGCGRPDYSKTLPDATELGSPRGFHIARTIVHLHSPYSYDACDYDGLPDGAVNSECLEHLRVGLCNNRVNFAFLTDHPSHMAEYEFDALRLGWKDDTLSASPGSGGVPVGVVPGCETGAAPIISVGYEAGLMPIGMTGHLDATIPDRQNSYSGEDAATATRLRTSANAVVMIPHPEGKTLAEIQAIAPDMIEIYNIHANVDPKIRKQKLGLPPFQDIPYLLAYFLDPYGNLNADYLFMSFVVTPTSYFEKWDALIAGSLRVSGWGGTDSHENVLPQTAADGERLDAHRRLIRMMSNHVLVNDLLSVVEVKTALQNGKGWMVFEGFGSPVGMDFTAETVGASLTTVGGVGETFSLGALTGGGDSVRLRVSMPVIHTSAFPREFENPEARIVLFKDGAIVSGIEGSSLEYGVSATGSYRAMIYIRPKHVRGFLADYGDQADAEYLWIATNPIYIDP